jgi:hypothetical protein
LNKIIASIMPNWLAFLNQIKWTEIALTHLEQNTAAGYYHDIVDGIATNFLVDHVKMWHEVVVALRKTCGVPRRQSSSTLHNYYSSFSAHICPALLLISVFRF